MDVLISVIIPAYNAEAYLARCLDSILAQTQQGIEAVVVDDGSQDATGRILDQYVEKYPERITALHVPNGGVTKARLTGVAAAHGQWIGFVDADDYIEPDMYARLLANARKYGAQISHCGYRLVTPNEVIYYYNTGRLAQQDKQKGLTALLDGSYVEPGLWNKLFHKTLFHSLFHGVLPEPPIRNYEDLLMNYYLFREAEKSVYEDFCPYHYELRAGSATTHRISEPKVKDPIRVMRILLEETSGNTAQHEAVRRRYIRMLCNTATMQLDGESKWLPAYRKGIRAELRRELPEILQKKHYGMRIKVIAMGAGLLPELYGWLHRMHILLRGLDKARSLKK